MGRAPQRRATAAAASLAGQRHAAGGGELGAGTAVPSVRHFSQRVLHQFGGRLVRINPREFEVPTRLDVGLPMGAAAGLAAIEQVLGWTR